MQCQRIAVTCRMSHIVVRQVHLLSQSLCCKTISMHLELRDSGIAQWLERSAQDQNILGLSLSQTQSPL